MTPVHTDEVSRAGLAVTFQRVKRSAQETDKLSLSHFATCHSKFAMSNRSFAANISVDSYVVRRIGEHKVRSPAIHEYRIDGFIEGNLHT
jgi:hypothetical protein